LEDKCRLTKQYFFWRGEGKIRVRIFFSKLQLLLITTFLGLSTGILFTQNNNDLLKKSGNNLYQIIKKLDDNDMINIYIWKTSINQEEYETELLKLGYDETIYGNENLFQKKIVNTLQDYNKDDRINEIRKGYKLARLQAIKKVATAANLKFLNDYNLSMDDVIYFSNYTSTIIIAMNKMNIKRIIKDNRVLQISIYEEDIQKNEMLLSVDQVNAGYGSIYNPGLKNVSQGGYDGSGVSIGIIEAASGRFDPDAPQLSPMVLSGQLEFVEIDGVDEEISAHATFITNIVAGQSYTYSGNTYEGIATGAQVYQSAVVNSIDVFNAFSQFAELGVDVINYSGGSRAYYGDYSSYDQEIDNLIYVTKIIFVNATGNDYSHVISPGKAYNAITVGSVDTKSTDILPESTPFEISTFSNYLVNTYMSNKPEIVAPGELIKLMATPTNSYQSIGTSLSAPHVTGVVAQLIEKYKSSVNINNYTTYFKGRLMLGAQSSIVNDTTHRNGDSTIFYNKQGAGFLDARNSAKTVVNFNEYTQLNALNQNYYVYIFTPTTDFLLRAILIFEKPENSQITSNYSNDLNLYLQTSGQTILSSSTSCTNIFEMLEYTILANQDVLLRINRQSYISSPLYISISCFWMEV
jgi:hypothetical protein